MWTWEFKEWRRGSEPNIRICGGLSVMPGSADPIFLCGLMVKVLGFGVANRSAPVGSIFRARAWSSYSLIKECAGQSYLLFLSLPFTHLVAHISQT